MTDDPDDPEQLGLFEAATSDRLGTSRASDPATSKAAALDNLPRSGSQKSRVLSALVRHQAGLTDYELGLAIGVLRSSAGKRRQELEELGLIERTGGTRPTDTGSDALIWRLTDAGWNVAARLLDQEGTDDGRT